MTASFRSSFLLALIVLLFVQSFAKAGTTGFAGNGVSVSREQPTLDLVYLMCVSGLFPSPNGGTSGEEQPMMGEIRLFTGGFIPGGWVKCDGQLLDIASYEALFTIIGTTFGGDGRTTFGVPDLRGRVPVGTGPDFPLGQISGSDSITLTTANLPAHTHSSNPDVNVQPVGSAAPISNRQPSLALTHLINLIGDFNFMTEVRLFAGNFAPRGWAKCEGQLLAVNTNQALFARLGIYYGGDGRVNFGLPDLRGRSIVVSGPASSYSYTVGEVGGSETQSLTVGTMPLHVHSLSQGTTGIAGGGSPISNMQPYVAMTLGLNVTNGDYPTADNGEYEFFMGEGRFFAGPSNLRDLSERGWTAMDGRTLPIQNNPLFAVTGNKYGGNGTTTFGVPNAQGRMVRGVENSLDDRGTHKGMETQTLSSAQLAVHAHDIPVNTPKPEIAITGNSRDIRSGDTTPDSLDGTDFISRGVDRGSVSATFIIANSGPGELNLTGTPRVQITGTHASNFTVTTQPASTVAATSGTTSFTIAFDPDSPGQKDATVSIANNDDDENPFTFAITGLGLSSNADLANLVPGNGSLSPAFTRAGTSYVVHAGAATTTTLTPTPVDAVSIRLQVNGGTPYATTPGVASSPITLNAGVNTVLISVDSPDGQTTKTYTVYIMRSYPPQTYPFVARSQYQIFNVPSGVTSIGVKAWGAGGGYGGGSGAFVSGQLSVTPNETLIILVGSGGIYTPPSNPVTGIAFGGGGRGYGYSATYAAGGGGGRSAVQRGNADIVTAGAGGGGYPAFGGMGGGGGVTSGLSSSGPSGVSTGGTQTAGGLRGSTDSSATDGSLYLGGDGNSTPQPGGGGGGSGYYGGAGGGDNVSGGYAGGGGSSLISNLTGVTSVNGANGRYQNTPPGGASDPDYATGIGVGGGHGTFQAGGNGRVVISIAVAPPEIELLGNAVDITSGDTTPSLADHTDFGGVIPQQAPVTRTFTVRNAGGAPLTLYGTPKVVISGPNAADFTVTTQPASPVAANGASAFIVSFAPTTLGLKTATVSLVSDDQDENPFTFAVSGMGASTNANLASLALGHGTLSPAFSSSVTRYIATGADVAASTLTPTVAEAGASLQVRVGTGNYSTAVSGGATNLTLTPGVNTVDVRVTATDGVTSKTYSVAIMRPYPPQTTTYSYTGGNQTYVVPAGVTSIAVKAWGAGGGDGGGSGAFVSGQLSVIPGETLTIVTGGGGQVSPGGGGTGNAYGGGGSGFSYFSLYTSGGGGGRSAIRRGSTELVNAGAGGGGYLPMSSYGGGGGLANGQNNWGASRTVTGGSQTSGGLRYTSQTWATNGSQFQGGNGNSFDNRPGGGGGGSGYFGGAGGGDNNDGGYAGAGGSSYTANLSGFSGAGGSYGTNGGSQPGGTGDPQYVSGIGRGGPAAGAGGHGMVLITAPPAPPEIAVSGNSVDISSGDISPSALDHTDFGSIVPLVDAPVVHTFTITNSGGSPLTLYGNPKVAISGTNAVDFTVTGEPSSTVLAGNGTTAFSIAFSPTTFGTKAATVTIANDDLDENPFTFMISGQGGNPAPVPIPSLSNEDVVSNGAAPGTDGATTIGNFDLLRRGGFLARNGQMVFPGTLKLGTGSPPVTAESASGLWKVGTGLLQLLARTGTTVPDVHGAQFATLPEVPGISESGDVSFLGSLVIGPGGVTADNDTGLWSELGGTGLSLLMRENENVPGLTNVKIKQFASGVYATATTGTTTGEAAFSVTYKGNSTKTAILRASVNAATTVVSVIATEGEPAPGASAGVVFASLAGSYSDPGRMNALGGFVFSALTTPGNKEGIWYQPPAGGAPVKVVMAGDNAPGTTGTTFSKIYRPSMGTGSYISFRAGVAATGDNADNLRNDGIWAGDISNLTCILRRGDLAATIPGMPAGSKVGNPWGGWLTGTRGAWKAWLDTDGNGTSAAPIDVHAIYTNLGGTGMRMTVKVGDAAPGTSAGVTLSGFDLPIVGGNNQYAFLGTLTGTGVTSANNEGLWRSAANGGSLSLVLRKGDAVTTSAGSKTVSKIDFPGSAQTDRRWEQPVIDSTGRLLIYLTFTDGSTSQILAP